MFRSGRGIASQVVVASAVLLACAASQSPRKASCAALYPEGNPDSALAIALASIEGAPLTLEDAIRMATARSTSVRDAEAALQAAEGAVRRERGRFDPEVFGEGRREGDDSPTASPFAGASVLRTRLTTALGGARVRLPLGTDLEASLNTTKTETNSAYATLNPEYDTFGEISIRQPLLAGFGPSARRWLSSAERTLAASRARYEDALLAGHAQAEETYWDLYAAVRNYAVRQLIFAQANSLIDETRVRAGAGLVGPNQVANARVFAAEQEQALLDSEETLDRVSDEMALLIGTRPAPGFSRFRPIDEPPATVPIEPADSLLAQALRRNKALQAAASDVAALRALARGARWDALPAVDLFGSVGGNGLSGTGREVVFGSDTLRTAISGGFGDTWRQVSGRDFPTWSAGVRVVIPIGFRAGAGERDRLRAEVARAEQTHTAIARQIEEQMLTTVHELEHASRRIAAAREGVEASQEQVRIGLVEYRNGRSTAFELVRLGADLASAQQRYSQALVRAAKAAARLRSLTAGGYPALVSK